jgi:DNA-binding response OmpR family regulator
MNSIDSILSEPVPSTAIAAPPSRSATSQAILYVEDDVALRRLSAMVLLQSGYRVDVAEDGQAGWEALRLGGYDLLITDHEMPRLSGLELVKRLRSAGHTLPVVVASGSVSAEETHREQCLKVAATLRKPFTPAQLLETVEEVLRAAIDVRRRSDPFFPVMAEAFACIQPVRGRGINE